jgi:alpha-L-fucosidase
VPPAASPFRNLDFGYATASQDKLYLFVKSLPKDGKLELPGVTRESRFGKPYLLGATIHGEGAIKFNDSGATLDAGAFLQSSSAGFLPVIVIPFTGRLSVRSAATISAEADGSVLLDTTKADKFLNYNGRGYEAPATIYKLRWLTDAAPGRYKAEVHYARSSIKGKMDLITGSRLHALETEAGDGNGVWSGEVTLSPGSHSVELTPTEPFHKGTALPVSVQSVQLFPLK